MPAMEERVVALEVEFRYLREKMTEIDADTKDNNKLIREIKDVLSQASGGWKAIAIVGGFSATIGGLLAKFGWAALFN